MRLFTKKKGGDHLRTLTEKEIQDKLYGSFRSPSIEGTDDSDRSLNSRLVSTLEKSPEPVTETEGPKTVWEEEQNRITAQKLFSPGNSKKKISKIGIAGRPKFPPGADIFRAFGDPLRKGIAALADFVVGVFEKAAQLVLSWDFRRPQVRRTFYWVLAVGILAVLFFNIHFLNDQREMAMKSPPKRIAAPGPKKKIHQKIPSLAPESQAAKPTAALETAGTRPLSVLAPSLVPRAPLEELLSAKEAPYVIQIATFMAQSDARGLVSRLKTEDLGAFVKPLSRTGGKVFYCVFVGRFENYSEAQNKLVEFRKRPLAKSFQDAFIRTL